MYPLSHCITKHVVCPFSWLISPATHERERVHHRALTVIFHILCDSLSQVLLHASLSFFSQAALHRNVHSGPIAKTILYLWGIDLLVFCAFFFLRKMAQKTMEKIPRSCTFAPPLCAIHVVALSSFWYDGNTYVFVTSWTRWLLDQGPFCPWLIAVRRYVFLVQQVAQQSRKEAKRCRNRNSADDPTTILRLIHK